VVKGKIDVGKLFFLQSMSADLPSPPLGQMLLVHGLTFSSHEFDLNYKDYSLARWLANQGYVVSGSICS
jgi:hypothetical protein